MAHTLLLWHAEHAPPPTGNGVTVFPTPAIIVSGADIPGVAPTELEHVAITKT